MTKNEAECFADLFSSIIAQAVLDAKNMHYYESKYARIKAHKKKQDAIKFFQSKDFEEYSLAIGLCPDAVRQKLKL